MDAREIFTIWRNDLDGTERFLYKERKENIENLVNDLYNAGASIEDVRFLKNEVLVSLITKEGMKNTGKYKGWKDNVINDFDDVVTAVYLTNTLDSIRDLNTINSRHYIEMNDQIIDWLYDTYNYVSREMLVEAHNPSSFLNNIFLEKYRKDLT